MLARDMSLWVGLFTHSISYTHLKHLLVFLPLGLPNCAPICGGAAKLG